MQPVNMGDSAMQGFSSARGMCVKCRTVAVAAVAWLGIMTAANAQNASVYVANSANSRILQARFDPPGTTVVIDDPNRLTQVRDIAIRQDGLDGPNLIACDRNGGRIVFYH